MRLQAIDTTFCLPSRLAHPALSALLAGTDLETAPAGAALGLICPAPGRLAVSPRLGADATDLVKLRYGLELAWLSGVPGLAAASAALLAAHAAGAFQKLLPHDDRTPVAGDGESRLFDALAGDAPVAADLHDAWPSLRATLAAPAILDDACIAQIRRLWDFALPTEALLVSGGDDRLVLDPLTGLNKYGCAPWPRPDIIGFASCTASSIEDGPLLAAERTRQTLLAAAVQAPRPTVLDQHSRSIGDAIRTHFGVEDLAETVLAASGTDAALLLTALLAAEHPDRVTTSILMSPSETGSGVPEAVQGRHFAACAASGQPVRKGCTVAGLAESPSLITIALRTEAGLPRDQARVTADCHRAIQAGLARGHVVLHAIDGSKTGLTAPSRATCQALAATYGERLDIAIDACQARIEPALVRWYLNEGFPVLVTGSKFFGAPGFCGAILFPRARLRRIAQGGHLPAGLDDYASVAGGLVSRRCPGLLLRWAAALSEMNAFAALEPDAVRTALERVGRSVRTMLTRDARLRLVAAPRPPGFGWSDRRSVFTFAIRGDGGWLSAERLRPIYQALGSTCTELSDAAASSQDRDTLSRRCQIGQPVHLGTQDLGGLRIALSARQVRQGGDQVAGLAAVFAKLCLLLPPV